MTDFELKAFLRARHGRSPALKAALQNLVDAAAKNDCFMCGATEVPRYDGMCMTCWNESERDREDAHRSTREWLGLAVRSLAMGFGQYAFLCLGQALSRWRKIGPFRPHGYYAIFRRPFFYYGGELVD